MILRNARCNNKDKNQQNAYYLHYCFNLTIESSTCFEHPSVHPQEDLYMQFYGISFMHLYKQSGRLTDVLMNLFLYASIRITERAAIPLSRQPVHIPKG